MHFVGSPMDFVWVLIFALIRSSIPSILEIQNVNLRWGNWI